MGRPLGLAPPRGQRIGQGRELLHDTENPGAHPLEVPGSPQALQLGAVPSESERAHLSAAGLQAVGRLRDAHRVPARGGDLQAPYEPGALLEKRADEGGEERGILSREFLKLGPGGWVDERLRQPLRAGAPGRLGRRRFGGRNAFAFVPQRRGAIPRELSEPDQRATGGVRRGTPYDVLQLHAAPVREGKGKLARIEAPGGGARRRAALPRYGRPTPSEDTGEPRGHLRRPARADSGQPTEGLVQPSLSLGGADGDPFVAFAGARQQPGYGGLVVEKLRLDSLATDRRVQHPSEMTGRKDPLDHEVLGPSDDRLSHQLRVLGPGEDDHGRSRVFRTDPLESVHSTAIG